MRQPHAIASQATGALTRADARSAICKEIRENANNRNEG